MMILRSALPPRPSSARCASPRAARPRADIDIEPADTDRIRATRCASRIPLGKIPALMLEDGTVLFDSRVILDYLDHRAGGGRIVPTDAERALFRAAPAGAVPTAFSMPVCCVYEGRWRPAEQARAEMGRSSGRQGRARARGARSCAACAHRAAGRRSDRACLRARLPRFPLRGKLARAIIHAWSTGSRASPRACRRSPRPSRRASER